MPKFASKESLYFETGWETLSCRQRRRKLTLFHKIHNNIAPEYLQDCLNIEAVPTYLHPLNNTHPITHMHTLVMAKYKLPIFYLNYSCLI
jgi:hypothetical protein